MDNFKEALRSMDMGPKMEGPGGDKLLQQAEHIWSMLDDMATQNPEGYSRFIKKQAKEYQELSAPPQPHMTVKTKFQDRQLYVNIVSWQRVPKPKSEQDKMPLFAAPLDSYVDKRNGERVSTIAIAVNPEVLAEYGVEANNAEERESFINLTLDYVQHLSGKSVNRNFTLLPGSAQFKGDFEKVKNFFTDSLKTAMKKDKSGEETENYPDPDIDLPESMLSQLANISISGTKGGQSKGSSHKASDDAPIVLPKTDCEKKPEVKKNLIQELHTEEVKLKLPDSTMKRSSSSLVLSVELPGVTSASQCELDISEDDVQLYAGGKYKLSMPLPSRIKDAKASAKFCKKRSILTIHMPFADS